MIAFGAFMDDVEPLRLLDPDPFSVCSALFFFLVRCRSGLPGGVVIDGLKGHSCPIHVSARSGFFFFEAVRSVTYCYRGGHLCQSPDHFFIQSFRVAASPYHPQAFFTGPRIKDVIPLVAIPRHSVETRRRVHSPGHV